MTSQVQIRRLLGLIVLLTSCLDFAASSREMEWANTQEMNGGNGDGGGRKGENGGTNVTSSSSSPSADPWLSPSSSSAGENEGEDDEDILEDENEDDGKNGQLPSTHVQDTQPTGTLQKTSNQGSVHSAQLQGEENNNNSSSDDSNNNNSNNNNNNDMDDVIRMHRPILVLAVTESESAHLPAVKVVFSKAQFQKWFYKLCTFGYLSLRMEVNPDGFVTGVMNSLVVGNKQPQVHNNYMCGLEPEGPTGSRNLTCVLKPLPYECDEWSTWSCFTPLLNNSDTDRCRFDTFGIIWHYEQTASVLGYDEDHLQLEACDTKCDVTPTWPEPEVPGGWETTDSDHSWDGVPPKKKSKGKNEDPSIYIYIGVGVAASGVLLAVVIIGIVCCVMKRRVEEKEKVPPDSKDGVPNPAFSPVVQASPQSSLEAGSGKAEGSQNPGAGASSTENESIYDYIDDSDYARGVGYSKLKDETKYNHDYKVLHRSHTTPELCLASKKLLESNPRYSVGANNEKTREYLELESQYSDGSGGSRYVAPPSAIRSAPPTIVRDGARRKHNPEDVYAMPHHEEAGPSNHDPSYHLTGFSPEAPPSNDHNDNEIAENDPDLSYQPNRDRNETLKVRPRVPSQRVRPVHEPLPPVPYHSYLEVLAPLPETRPPLSSRGQGRSSLPSHPTLSEAESLGPQPPLPRRNATFHYYSQPEATGPASLEE